jgi:hypothetical protein
MAAFSIQPRKSLVPSVTCSPFVYLANALLSSALHIKQLCKVRYAMLLHYAACPSVRELTALTTYYNLHDQYNVCRFFSFLYKPGIILPVVLISHPR